MSEFVKRISDFDIREQAWMISRPNLTEKPNLEALSKMDFSLNDLKIVALHIKSSLVFREILFNLDNSLVWSQTSRVNKMEDIELPSYLNELQTYKSKQMLIESINYLQHMHQDDARGFIPLSSLSEYVIALPFRSWISILKYLDTTQYRDNMVPLILEALDIKNLDDYPYKPIKDHNIPKIEAIDGYIKIRQATIPFSLRCQLIRHKHLKVYDNLLTMIKDKGLDLETNPYNMPIEVTIVTDENTWHNVMSSRICWLAHFELWQNLLGNFSYEDFKQMLPCGGVSKDCKFKKDNEARIQGKDPGIPCPILCNKSKYIGFRLDKLGNTLVLDYYKKFMGVNKSDIMSTALGIFNAVFNNDIFKDMKPKPSFITFMDDMMDRLSIYLHSLKSNNQGKNFDVQDVLTLLVGYSMDGDMDDITNLWNNSSNEVKQSVKDEIINIFNNFYEGDTK